MTSARKKEQIASSTAAERSFAILTSLFGVIALLLASIGVYGIVASGVARRVNEIGIRMALGAQREQVVRGILAEAVGFTFSRICAGFDNSAFSNTISQFVPFWTQAE